MRSLRISLLAALALPASVLAQDTTKTHADSTAAAKPPKAAPSIDFSGVVFGNYQYHTEAGSRAQNKFDVERAYLTFKMPAGERASIRVTTDLFQQTSGPADSYYKGWVVRAKYAYLQYDFAHPKNSKEWGAVGRVGLVHTMFIDHEENFWPRWLSLTPLERAGFFSSADAGVAGIFSLPNKMGEFYTAITNGPGYASRETDRFKDYQARLTLTPFASGAPGLLQTFAVDGWVYRGATASRFVSGGSGQIGPISRGLDRNRWGIFAGIRDPRLTIGADFAQRSDGGELGANTPASPASVFDSTGRAISAYTVFRPFQLADAQSRVPLGVVVRFDNVKPNTSSTNSYNVLIAGLTWDLSKKAALSLDYQRQAPSGTTGIPRTSVYFLHWVANF